MTTILVPIDFSNASSNALRYAFDLALHNGARLLVLNVLFPNESVDNNIYSAFWTDEYYAQRKKDVQTWVHRHQRAASAQKLTVDCEIYIGFPTVGIVETAEKNGADLIVMGTTGATGLRGVLLGSVAASVLRRTRLPVLVVPKRAKPQHHSPAVFATDFHLRSDDASLQTMREVLAQHDGLLKIVHILDRPEDRPDAAREAAFSRKLEGIRHDIHYLHDRDAPQAAVVFLESVDAGLLVAVSHEHGLLHRIFNESFTRRLAHRIRVPMLVLHDSK